MVEGRTTKQLMPHTRESLAHDLSQLGLEKGMTVIVHSSLKSFGYVSGGPIAVIQALTDVITPSGTIAMPMHTSDYSDPALWQNPPVPENWWPIIREHMPAFDPHLTPTEGMGIIAETFRKWSGVIRSSHPTVSFGAWGRYAEEIVSNHSLSNSLGERSPLARIYDLDGWILLLGVGFGNNTSFHLAEYRSPGIKECQQGAPIFVEGKREWKAYEDLDTDSSCFEELGIDFQKDKAVNIGKVGSANTRLFRQKEAVDFAKQWLSERNTR